MSTAAKRNTALFNLAMAGVGCALLARGILIIKMAPPAVTPAEHASPQEHRRIPERPAPRLIPFPQLAPEIEEAPVELIDGGTKGDEGQGPLVPLDADVVGITWFSNPDYSLANMVVAGEHSVHSIHDCIPGSLATCNEVAPGYRLQNILPDRVVLLHELSKKTQEILLVDEPVGKVTTVASAPVEPPPTAAKGKGSAISQLMDNVKQTGPNTFEAPPGMREEVLGRLTEVAMEGRWMPYFEGGKIVGFKLAQTARDSAFNKIGLKSGDVIRSVNGLDISSPDKILEAFNKLRDARNISVDIQRGDAKGPGGGKVSMNYNIN